MRKVECFMSHFIAKILSFFLFRAVVFGFSLNPCASSSFLTSEVIWLEDGA